VGRTRLAIAPTNPDIMYASIANPTSGALFRMMKSTDGGQTWTQLTSAPNYMGNQGSYDTTLAVDPNDPNIVYAGGQTGFIRSINGGASWSSIAGGTNAPHVDHHAIGFDANGRLLDGNDGGIWRLNSPSPLQWSNLNGNLQITEFVGIALHPTNPDIIYG